jgi:nucleoside-diphosphate-sugar epimerase
MPGIAEEDLQHILTHTNNLWEQVRNKSIFLTGGTGFFGKWLAESFLYINRLLRLNAKLTVLTRSPEAFLQQYPFYTTDGSVNFIKGDILDFNFPAGDYQFIIHAATQADAALNNSRPLLMLDTVTAGTRRVLDFARQQPVEALLFTSSGAVYGKQPPEVTHISEDQYFTLDINNPQSAYAEGKRLAELYCSIYYHHYKLPVKIARCFAFVGPYLPLDKHFAIGNFLSNSLKGEDIIIKGDGTPYRSYLYAADLAIWLWTILLKGDNNVPYNVGSDEDYSLRDVAHAVKKMRPGIDVQVLTAADKAKPAERYIPNIDRAKNDLNLQVRFCLTEAIDKSLRYYESI